MRLIDADELKKMFPDKGEGAWTYNITAKAYIDAQPTVDLWNYPSKGEYPPKNGKYFCKVDSLVTQHSEGWYDVVIWGEGSWVLSPYAKVVAWQYIVPPKEEA